jgi:DNA-binding NarL/FixJ family response regulator
VTAIRVMVADDQPLVRDGLRTILEAQPDIEVAAEASTGREAIEMAARHRLDVILMDIRMPDVDGITACREVTARAGAPRVVVVTTHDLDEYVYDALRAGACGFLLKDAPREQLVSGVRAAHAGETLLAPAVTRRLVETFVRRPPPRSDGLPPLLGELTARELEVLRLIARGLSNAEIGTAVFVAEATVKSHVSRILAKLGLRDRVHAVVLAYECGLVAPGDDRDGARARAG